jgi:hypothetical protein
MHQELDIFLSSFNAVVRQVADFLPKLLVALVLLFVGWLLAIATHLLTTAFAILFGAVCFALALAFGLGGRDWAADVIRKWSERHSGK